MFYFYSLLLVHTIDAADVRVDGRPQRPYYDPCAGKGCVNAKSFLTQIGYGVQKTILPIGEPLTNMFFLGDDIAVSALKSSGVTDKANNLKSAVVPIHLFEEGLSPIKTPVDKLKSKLALDTIYLAEPIWRVLDGIIPQPKSKLDVEQSEQKEEAVRQCRLAGYPDIDPSAMFNIDGFQIASKDQESFLRVMTGKAASGLVHDMYKPIDDLLSASEEEPRDQSLEYIASKLEIDWMRDALALIESGVQADGYPQLDQNTSAADSVEAVVYDDRKESEPTLLTVGLPADFLESVDSNNGGKRRLATRTDEGKDRLEGPQPCSNIDVLFPVMVPARLQGPIGLFEIGDYKQRKGYNERFNAIPDPLLKEKLDQKRVDAAQEYMSKNGTPPNLRNLRGGINVLLNSKISLIQ